MGVLSSLGNNPDEIIKSFKEKNVSFERPVFDSEVVTSPVRNFNARHIRDVLRRPLSNRGAQFAVRFGHLGDKKLRYQKDDLAEAGLFVGLVQNLNIGGEFPEIQGGTSMGRSSGLMILKFLPKRQLPLLQSCQEFTEKTLR